MPRFEYCFDDDEGSIRSIEAHDAREAAEEAVALYEQRRAEYPVAAGCGSTVVLVYDAPIGPPRRFRVHGDLVPLYMAREELAGCALESEATHA